MIAQDLRKNWKHGLELLAASLYARLKLKEPLAVASVVALPQLSKLISAVSAVGIDVVLEQDGSPVINILTPAEPSQ